MTRQLPESHPQPAAGPASTELAGTGWPPEGEGQLPFSLRIGVTGHRRLTHPAALVPGIRAAVQGVVERFLGPGAEPALLVISALAEGADRLVATEVLARPDATMEAVLPLPPADYLDDFTGDASKAEFTEMLGRATSVWVARPGSSRDEAYERAGRHVVDRADVLIALWDGEPPRGRGGTATVVSYAREQGVPVAWVSTSSLAAPVYWYDEQRAARVAEAAREFREYNAAPIPEFTARARGERDRLAPAGPAGPPDSLRPACSNVAGWITPYFVRADVLATRLERIFQLTNWTMFLAAAAAVVVVAVQVTVWPRLTWITAAEVVLLLVLVAAPLVSRRLRVLDRWISYRFLAERLRSGYFLALAGAGDRTRAGERREPPAYLSDPTEVWIERALGEITARRPPVRFGPADVVPLRGYLSEHWIGAQIRYHEGSARRQGAWDSRLFAATGVLFLITAVAAFLHLLGWGEHHGSPTEFGLLLIVLSICVPAIGAAVHGIRTQSEFRRHCQRYQRMAGLLRQLDADLARADSIPVIHEIAADAEHLMRAENSDWFGVMRFHDVELITLARRAPQQPGDPRTRFCTPAGIAGKYLSGGVRSTGEGSHAKAGILHELTLTSAGHRGVCGRSERITSLVIVWTMSSFRAPARWLSPAAPDLGGHFRLIRAEAGMTLNFLLLRFSRAVHEAATSHRSSPVRPSPPNQMNHRPKAPTPAPKQTPRWPLWVLLGGAVLGAVLLFHPGFKSTTTQDFSYSSFVGEVTANKVSTATISSTGVVTGKLHNGVAYSSQIPTALNDQALSPLLLKHKVQVTGGSAGTSIVESLLFSFLPLLLLVGAFIWFARRGRKQMGGIMSIGKSKAKLYDEERPTTRFTDIAGYEGSKAEVMEVVDFLKHPQRYAQAGAVGPKGILMVGPPGTGKTLMAKAVAGEAGVPFFALSGSSFVEMFVGVGASRVRDLFSDARKHAPSIIFIDEIDAIGGRRGPGGFGSNDEREQTLNQLLSDMDGFEPGASVVVMGATNRAEILDSALLRPGRFDRTVDIPLPNQKERAAILTIHGRGKSLAPDVDLAAVSRGTPGFSGADLANLVNEAAINAVRDHRAVLSAADFSAARDRLLIGQRDASNALLPEEKNSVAVHEAGHALVAVLSEHADPVAKVTILPRGAALGVTEQLPEFERHLYRQSYLTDTLAVRLGGRAAEIIVLGEPSTGASNDLAGATDLATRMVREWGFSTEMGPIGYGPEGPSRDNPFAGRPYAEETQRAIDREVATLLREAETRATTLLRTNLDKLSQVVDLLLDRETIDGSDLTAIVGAPERHGAPGMTWAPRAVAMAPADAEHGGTSAANGKAAPVS